MAKKDSVKTILIVTVIILIIAIIVLIIFLTKSKTDTVKAANIPQILGEFAAIPNVNLNSLRPQYRCSTSPDGSSGNSICSFVISDLYQAINICNKYPSNICGGFYYNTNGSSTDSSKSMTMFITGYPVTSTVKDNPNNASFGDAYLRQSNLS
jgi:hypothetical protein